MPEAVKEITTDIAMLLRVFIGPELYPAVVPLLFLKLNWALPRRYTMYLIPNVGPVQDDFQTPSSLRGSFALAALLIKAIVQVKAQALLQYQVERAQNASRLPIVMQDMLLVAASGLWFMVGYAEEFEIAWCKYTNFHQTTDDAAVLMLLGTEEAQRKLKLSVRQAEVEGDADEDEDGTVPDVQPGSAGFKFERNQHVVGPVSLGATTVFHWEPTLYNLKEKEGWEIWQEIKQLASAKVVHLVNSDGE
ncbi:hypothetical protein BDP27DRAFT_1429094 [Rhodocollybia butyracea]|uniref:Uncharacterized protein n=1 Tax=Rhodocollybia butyracea TaxID=206335 RepID=A0A9P5TZA9_9AGAR|nr:hypothetical protein BDP27DRAFT_1429094 [Rhodocollybia butyracea]